MTGVSTRGPARPGRELAAVLLGGAAGAGVVLLASRQGLARVIVRPPRPLPATVTELSAQDLRPAIAALAVAALASLAAVLATRGLMRRLTGLITITLGAGIALLAAGKVTSAAVLAAAGRSGASPASGSGAGTAAGSVTAGTGSGGTVGSLAGFGSHVVLGGSAWRAAMVAGAALIAAAGLVVLLRARRLPAMSGRYRAAGPARRRDRGTGRGTGLGPRSPDRDQPRPPRAREHVGIAERGGRSDGIARVSRAASPGWRPGSTGRQGQVSGDYRDAAQVRGRHQVHAAESAGTAQRPPAQGRGLAVNQPSVRSGAPGNPPEGAAEPRERAR